MGKNILNYVILLIGDSKLLLRNTLDRIILPFFTAVITCNKSLLFTKDLIAFFRPVAVNTVRTGRLNIVPEKSFLCHIRHPFINIENMFCDVPQTGTK